MSDHDQCGEACPEPAEHYAELWRKEKARAEAAEATIARVREQAAIRRVEEKGDYWDSGWNAAMKQVAALV